MSPLRSLRALLAGTLLLAAPALSLAQTPLVPLSHLPSAPAFNGTEIMSVTQTTGGVPKTYKTPVGTAILQNFGTSGASLCLLNAACSWSSLQAFGGDISLPNVTAHGVLLGEGASGLAAVTLVSGQVLIGQGASLDPAPKTVSGDCALANTGFLTCTSFSGTPFKSAAGYDVGTSGVTVPLLSTANSWAAEQLFPNSTTSSASLNCGQGVAPTTPNNGDMWCTSVGVFAQLGGSTFQLGGSSFGVTHFNARAGDVTLTSADVTGALGFTPLNAAAPSYGGNAASASRMQNGLTIGLIGDVSCTSATTFLNSNITISGCVLPAILAGSATVGSPGNPFVVPWITYDAKGRITAAGASDLPYATNSSTGVTQLATNAQAIDGLNQQEVETPGAMAANTAVGESCGSNCTAARITYPGGMVLVSGKYDCGSASCWSGGNTSVSDAAASVCYSGVAVPYNPGGITSPRFGIQVVNIAGNGVTFSVTGGNNNVQGFMFTLMCHN